MRFDNDYWSAVDKQSAQYLEVSPRYLGVSTHPAKDQLAELKGKIFSGAAAVELGFMGYKKGARAQGNITPEMFGREEREAMRQMAKINEVELSTHSSANVMGSAGMGEGGFSDERREDALHEIERTIDFAADTSGGGPVVIHAAEFPREIAAKYPEFELYPEEKRKATVYLVDKVTGQVIRSIKKDEKIIEPVWLRNERGQYVDEFGNLVNMRHRVPAIDEQGNIKVEAKDWNSFEEQAKEWNKEFPDQQRTAAQVAYNASLDARKMQSESWAKIYGADYQKNLGYEKKLLEARKEYSKLEESMPEEEKALIRQRAESILPGIVPPESRTPLEAIDHQLDQVKKAKEYYREGSLAYAQEAKQIEEVQKRAVPIEEYGIEKSADTIARAAISAYDKERSQKLEKPLYIVPENVFPESGYGSHPQELKELILKSREAMADRLIDERHISRGEAEKIAKDHVKATFDIGHAYTWKKFFKGPSEEFDSWLKKQVKDLTDQGIIGHVHLSDNFGYYDEHLSPGQGSVPIKDFVKQLELSGFKKPMIVEAGAQREGEQWRALTGAWRTLNSPVYRLDSARTSWSDIEESYFGRTGSPQYVVGDFAPSKDWTLWSETQLE